MKTEKESQSTDNKNMWNTYIKFTFENLEEVQEKLHRLVELEKEARALLQELASDKLILNSEIRWPGTPREGHTHPHGQINDQASGYDIDRIAEGISQKLQEICQK